MSDQNRETPPGKTPRTKNSSDTPYEKSTPENPPTGKKSTGMEPPDESAPENFESDINQLVDELKTALGDGASRWYYEESSDILYIEIEALDGMSEGEAERKAGPVLEACEIEFEEIILLPYTQ